MKFNRVSVGMIVKTRSILQERDGTIIPKGTRYIVTGLIPCKGYMAKGGIYVSTPTGEPSGSMGAEQVEAA